MNEKIKKIFAWIGGACLALLAVLCGKRRRDANSKRVSDIENGVADGRQTVNGIRESNQQLAGTVEGITKQVDDITDGVSELADTMRESASTVEDARRATGNAHDAIRFSLEVLENAEKRNNDK